MKIKTIPSPVPRTVLLLGCVLLGAASASRSRAALTAVNFNGSITSSGPGSLSVAGGMTTAFNTISGFGLASMAGGDRGVMSFSAAAAANASGLQFTHAAASPATTGYSILMDVYFSAIPDYLSLLQLDNTADADLFARGAGSNLGNAGISSDYGTGAGPLLAGAWHRFILTVDPGFGADALRIYANGSLINTVTPAAAGRYDLSDPTFLIFGDEDGETAPGYISQFAFADQVLSAGEIAALGGANAAPVPETSASLLAFAAAGLMTVRRTRRPAVTGTL